MLQQRVLKLQRDLEDAKAESRYFRAKRLENPVVTQNRPRFTSTPVPRYAGGSNWDQYREVFEAIVCSNGWDEVTAALQLIAHLDGGFKCGFVGTGGPTHTSRGVIKNVIGTLRFPR